MIKKQSLSVRLVCIVLLGLLLNGCRKEDFIPVSGLITDPNLAIPVEGAKVELWTQQIEGGIFAANYVLAGTNSTGIGLNY
jgi:protocatechuate 3,4-dioxygenase beta subunit